MAFAVAASAGATMALAGIAPRAGLADDPAGAPERKLQPHAVPAIGGAAVLVGLLAASAASAEMVPDLAVWPALLLAFALGSVDDRTAGGLGPGKILVGQAIVAAALLAGGWRLGSSATSFLAAMIAMNAANTFDNADGAASSLAILGLGAGPSLAAAPLIGFLPFNLWLRRGLAPLAYLGNAGSHVVGILLLVDPIARAALLLPCLDLARVVVERIRADAPPWKGDRRHLAHRLQNAGLAPTTVAVVLLAIAAPAVLGARASAEEGWSFLPLALGVAMTGGAFALAVIATRRPA
jgi:UDP-N-acetylmuramyl pentapeptide phosphotransferase/UDP-N-acetylglucosamine-1-phosphate transferase